jgi:2-oxoglutarate ferredoxin oxidoreductase subunit gamma
MNQNHSVTKKEILLTGFGGQGIVLAGKIMAQAAALGDHKQSTLVQAYGPEARGGACSAQVIIAEDEIYYPNVRLADILICMSQAGYDKFIDLLKEDGILIIDQDLVLSDKITRDYFAIPATRIAEELGRKMMANIIMVGFFTAVTGAISQRAAQETVLTSVPKGTEEMNGTALEKGFNFGTAVLKGREKKASGRTGV